MYRRANGLLRASSLHRPLKLRQERGWFGKRSVNTSELRDYLVVWFSNDSSVSAFMDDDVAQVCELL